MTRRLVAGVDSSTQSCKVVIRDAATGELVRQGSAPHPDGSEVAPQAWLDALGAAVAEAGGLEDVAALSVAGQQHGMICLDADGAVVRDALLWNDTRSAGAAAELVAELGDAAWAEAMGSLPVASFTVAKVRWLARHEPEAAGRTAAVCLPHDWLTWRLLGPADGARLGELVTDRSDASGTGYWSPGAGVYRADLLDVALGGGGAGSDQGSTMTGLRDSPPNLRYRDDEAERSGQTGDDTTAVHRLVALPRVLGPSEAAGTTSAGLLIGPGAGDNAAAALGLGAGPGDVVVSIGTSGTVFAVSDTPTADSTGTVAGFADATGRFLPLVCTLNAARVLEAAASILNVGLDELSRLALEAPPGADGLTVIPYLEGERTPNRPDATGSVHGLTLATSTPAHLARAAVEGMLCGLADGLDALTELGVPVRRILLIGGGARSEAVRRIAPTIFGYPVVVPEASEYVADGAARQAAWVLSGEAEPPKWEVGSVERYEGEAAPWIRERYRALSLKDL